MRHNSLKALVAGTALTALAAGSAHADFVINDDLIVDGSACIGFDCVNGESFGFDTLRLKENNLRIKFDDTSVAASFPRNDWQLTANDSANGGLSKFSIDDISGSRTPFTIEAGARSHSLYVDDGGRIGSRTSTPSTEIHTIDGDTPTLRLQQDGSSGFAPQTWDVAGNETNFFIRDVTNGSQLPFRIRPDAPTSSIFIDVDGDVGLGTSSPGAPLHVTASSGDSKILVEETSATEAQRDLLQVTNNGSPRIRMTANSGGAVAAEWVYTVLTTDEMRISQVGSGVTEMEIDGGTGNVTIAGEITTAGSCSGGCDAVFDDGYELHSIAEHARLMWENKHLPSVGPTEESGPMNLSKKVGGMLNELEKAHIYIEQLHKELEETKKVAGMVGELQKEIEALKSKID